MTTYTLDTHATIREFQEAGMDARQAEVVVAAISRSDAELVTKADLKAEIAGVKAELKDMATKTDLVEVKADLLKVAIAVVIAIILANATMTIALIRFLP